MLFKKSNAFLMLVYQRHYCKSCSDPLLCALMTKGCIAIALWETFYNLNHSHHTYITDFFYNFIPQLIFFKVCVKFTKGSVIFILPSMNPTSTCSKLLTLENLAECNSF